MSTQHRNHVTVSGRFVLRDAPRNPSAGVGIVPTTLDPDRQRIAGPVDVVAEKYGSERALVFDPARGDFQIVRWEAPCDYVDPVALLAWHASCCGFFRFLLELLERTDGIPDQERINSDLGLRKLLESHARRIAELEGRSAA